MLKDLERFTGSEQFYRHAFVRKVLYTEGAKYVANAAGAYWLLDEIAFSQMTVTKLQNEAFQVWKLQVTGSKAKIVVEDGNDNVVFTKAINFTDFPEPGITLWCVDNVIMLPSEY